MSRWKKSWAETGEHIEMKIRRTLLPPQTGNHDLVFWKGHLFTKGTVRFAGVQDGDQIYVSGGPNAGHHSVEEACSEYKLRLATPCVDEQDTSWTVYHGIVLPHYSRLDGVGRLKLSAMLPMEGAPAQAQGLELIMTQAGAYHEVSRSGLVRVVAGDPRDPPDRDCLSLGLTWTMIRLYNLREHQASVVSLLAQIEGLKDDN